MTSANIGSTPTRGRFDPLDSAPLHRTPDMRMRRRGLTVLELVIILLVVGLVIFFLLRMRGGEQTPAGTGAAVVDTAITAAPLAPGAPLADRLALVAPLDTVASAGDTVEVRVRATGPSGAGVANAEVRFAVEAGGGRVEPATATTNDMGEADVRWVLGGSPGSQRLRAVVAGNDAAALTTTIAATARTGAASPGAP